MESSDPMKGTKMLNRFKTVFTFALVVVSAPVLHAQEIKSCQSRLSTLGIPDAQSQKHFCSENYNIDFSCVEKKVVSGLASSHEALVLCSEKKTNANNDEQTMVTQSVMSSQQENRTVVKVYQGQDLVLAFGLAFILNSQKKCISGPFTDFDGKNHKVLGHGGGNALGTALVGWATNNCNNGVKTMILMSAAREQMKINMGYHCEWNSMLWDGVGIYAGAELCQWLQKNVARPQFLQDLTEKIFGTRSSITVLPNGHVGVSKDFN